MFIFYLTDGYPYNVQQAIKRRFAKWLVSKKYFKNSETEMTTSVLNKDQKYTFDNTRQNPNVQGSPLFHAINITQSNNERNSLSAAGLGGFFQPPRMCAWDLLYVSDLLVIGCNMLSTHRITKSCKPTIKFARFAQGFKMIIHSDSVTLSVCLSLVFLSPPQYVWSSGQFAENILHKAVYTWKQKKSHQDLFKLLKVI